MYYSLNSQKGPYYVFWQGFVAGAAESYFGMEVQTYPSCQLPSNVSVGQEVQITLNYMKKNPELWNQFPYMMVWNAMYGAFPCPSK